jgi:hypothetical protein
VPYGGVTNARSKRPCVRREATPVNARHLPGALSLAALALTETRFAHRTKAEHRATILLPNPVAAHDTKRDAMDGCAKILKENKTT